MPDTTTEPTVTAPEVAIPEPAQNVELGEPATQQEQEAEGKPGREAARYRRQLREVETERDELRGQLDNARRAVVEHSLGNLTPAAFWQMHSEVSDLLDDAGTVDLAKVTAAARGIHEALGLPGVFSNARQGAIGPYVPGVGTVPVGDLNLGAWPEAFKPKR